ncbi:MAG: DUF5522 domain-containing protein [Acidobacteriota bacterium]
MLRSNQPRIVTSPESLVEGEDYYWEGEAMVFTERYHLRRGFCCESGCRHCPFGESRALVPDVVNRPASS